MTAAAIGIAGVIEVDITPGGGSVTKRALSRIMPWWRIVTATAIGIPAMIESYITP
jgi:hypothetical protein